jgi:hypothetical protein
MTTSNTAQETGALILEIQILRILPLDCHQIKGERSAGRVERMVYVENTTINVIINYKVNGQMADSGQ